MSSASLQSRINAFEALAGPSSASSPPSPPRNISRRPPAASNLLESPLSSTASRLPPITPSYALKSTPTSPSSSPPHVVKKESLIDLKDWVVDDGPSPPRPNGFPNNVELRTPTKARKYSNGPPLINLESPPKSKATNGSYKAPPLPPRKPSLSSLKAAAAGSSTSLPLKQKSPPPPLPTRHSDSLTVEHTYPPPKLDSELRAKNGHAPASSISSFHSVSLSSDTDPSTPGSVANFITTFPMDREQTNGSEGDAGSLDESFENVSITSLASPNSVARLSYEWEKASGRQKRSPVPPKLPQRPGVTSAPSSRPPSIKSPPPLSNPTSPKIRATTSFSSAGISRRIPPPPPPSRSSASDRSSIMSNTSNFSISTSLASNSPVIRQAPPKLTLMRPTPVPVAARKRYESVFNCNVMQRRKAEKDKQKQKPALLSPTAAKKTRQAAGWRGLSVDLITNEDHPMKDQEEAGEVDSTVASDDVLEGHIVRHIWSRSKLDKTKLRDIWDEFDTTHNGALSMDAFVKGMWRIDEELRRIQLRSSASSYSSSASSLRRGLSIPRPNPLVVLR